MTPLFIIKPYFSKDIFFKYVLRERFLTILETRTL